ncbi:hypothetical protein P5704_027215 (plasmid) [Pseudomonas sp. FeN3W]|nr:hypothetical protein P5704_027215 [Pseudomonas sp. FeN3W]
MPSPMNTDVPMTEAQAYAVKLSAKEEDLLVKLATKPNQQLSLLIDQPNIRAINSLVRKGMASDIMGTFWKITDAGRLRVTKIY